MELYGDYLVISWEFNGGLSWEFMGFSLNTMVIAWDLMNGFLRFHRI